MAVALAEPYASLHPAYTAMKKCSQYFHIGSIGLLFEGWEVRNSRACMQRCLIDGDRERGVGS